MNGFQPLIILTESSSILDAREGSMNPSETKA